MERACSALIGAVCGWLVSLSFPVTNHPDVGVQILAAAVVLTGAIIGLGLKALIGRLLRR